MSEKRIQELIEQHRMIRHPEGCYFVEIFRSPLSVQPADERPTRSALTTILYLMPAGEISHFHRVRSDEIWSHLEGDPIEQIVLSPELELLNRRELAASGSGQAVHSVEANWWQAARSIGAYSLVSCTVGPGFDFEDFEMARDSEFGNLIRDKYPHLSLLI